jgi:hypothetical protein
MKAPGTVSFAHPDRHSYPSNSRYKTLFAPHVRAMDRPVIK